MIKAISVSTAGQRSAESTAPTASVTPGGDTTAPSTPTGFSATAVQAGIDLKWTNPADVDFQAVQVFRETSDTFPGGSPYITIAGERGKAMAFRDRSVGYGQIYYYWLKAVDFSGNASSQTSSVNATPSRTGPGDIEPGALYYHTYFDSISGWIQTTTGSGTVSLVDGELDLDHTTASGHAQAERKIAKSLRLYDWSKQMVIAAVVRFDTWSVVNNSPLFRFVTYGEDVTASNKHFGFFVGNHGAEGFGLYAVTYVSPTLEASFIQTISQGDELRLRAVKNADGTFDFYVNDVLETSISSGPSSGSSHDADLLYFWLGNQGQAVAANIAITESYFWQGA
jgi:hypothetical protein